MGVCKCSESGELLVMLGSCLALLEGPKGILVVLPGAPKTIKNLAFGTSKPGFLEVKTFVFHGFGCSWYMVESGIVGQILGHTMHTVLTN